MNEIIKISRKDGFVALYEEATKTTLEALAGLKQEGECTLLLIRGT